MTNPRPSSLKQWRILQNDGRLTMAESERYLMLVLCKIKDSYYDLDPQERVRLTSEHVGDLRRFSDNINHLVTLGGSCDQVALIEADDLKTLHDAAETFKSGNKGRHIEVIDSIFGIRVTNKSEFEMIGNR
jgi:hypothetical protein